MDEKVTNNQKKVMLVQDAKDGKVKAVKNVDKDGNIQTTDLTANNAANLLNVNTTDSGLEAFFRKFMEELDNPSHTGIFMMAEEVLNWLVKIDLDPKELDRYRIDPAEELGRQQEGERFQPMDTTKIDMEDMARKGINLQELEPHLKAMSYGHKSHGLIDMNPEMEPGGVRISTKGRVSLEEQPDGTLRVIPHYWQEKPNLDSPFYGKLLDEQVKANIAETRHAGKVLDLELTPGVTTPCFVSRDKWTNTLEAMPVELLQKRTQIKDAELSEGKQVDFYSGGKVLLEGYTTRTGYKRDAYIQIDAADRNFEFSYNGLDRNRYAQQNKQVYQRDNPAQERQRTFFIPKKILGVEVPEHAYKQWQEAVNFPDRQKDIKGVYMAGMVKDRQGEPFNAWIKPNFEKGKLDFFKWNPDYVRKQGATVTPVQESKTQVAVNSQGKINEATKHVNEPLRQGQQKPTEQQKARQRKSKGVSR